jgi:hypothetical protein
MCLLRFYTHKCTEAHERSTPATPFYSTPCFPQTNVNETGSIPLHLQIHRRSEYRCPGAVIQLREWFSLNLRGSQ